jgi:hypothetical protein
LTNEPDMMYLRCTNPRGLGVSVEVFTASDPGYQPHRFLASLANAINSIHHHVLYFMRRTTHVCFSQKFWPASVLDFLLVCGPVRGIMSHWWARFICDGWFQGHLATEKKRPCKESLLVMSQERSEQASKFSRLRVGSRSHDGAYVRVQLDCREIYSSKTPSLLRATRNRRRSNADPLESRGNAPLCKESRILGIAVDSRS